MNSPRPEDLERLRGSRRPRIAFVSHGFGGGVGRHIEELAAALEADAEILLMEPFRKSFVALRWLRSGEDLALWFRKDEEWEALLSVLAGIGIDRLHYHHVHGMPRAVLDLPARLGVPHDVTLHDYFAACPNYHLTGPDGRFCGGGPQCLRCVEAGPAQWPMSIEAWRASFGKWLEAAQRVIAPSQDSARRLGEFFPDARFVVWPHSQASLSSPTALRVLVPGAISPEKGLDLLEACVDDAARRKLPLHFRVLGYTARPIEPWPRQPYSIAGEFPEGRLPELLA
ncbi:MAG TPA: glycosyltransferase, partial [Usitatibacter sp.]